VSAGTYAAYRDGREVARGTAAEVGRALGIGADTVRAYATPSMRVRWQRRAVQVEHVSMGRSGRGRMSVTRDLSERELGIVRRCAAGRLSRAEAARMAYVHPNTMGRYVRMYREETREMRK
jgi:DNA-binding CsgD family transcriptional regulator